MGQEDTLSPCSHHLPGESEERGIISARTEEGMGMVIWKLELGKQTITRKAKQIKTLMFTHKLKDSWTSAAAPSPL